DLAVRFTQDENGRAELVTTRAPHGTRDWNPFIEPRDHMRHAEGRLRQIECDGNKVTAVAVDTTEGPLRLSIPDPQHVLMRKAPSEFLCGSQPSTAVIVDYAVSSSGTPNTGLLRGMEFR